MKAVAREKYVRMSPQKVRQVLALIKDKNVDDALTVLHFTSKRAAKVVEKALRSAVANFFDKEEAAQIPLSEVYVRSVSVDQGPTLKRFRPMSMGRVGRVRKKTSHITVVVEEKN